jgi:hypothetical protein
MQKDKKKEKEIESIWKVGQLMWKRDHHGIYNLLTSETKNNEQQYLYKILTSKPLKCNKKKNHIEKI